VITSRAFLERMPIDLGVSLKNFALLFTDDLYLAAWLGSLRISATSTLVTLLLGYPMAYAIARAAPGIRPLLLMAVILPFWTSFLIRVYAWIGGDRPAGLRLVGLFLAMSVGTSVMGKQPSQRATGDPPASAPTPHRDAMFVGPKSRSYQQLTPTAKGLYAVMRKIFGIRSVGGWRAVTKSLTAARPGMVVRLRSRVAMPTSVIRE
jgi:hypothetical protein